MQQGKSWSDIVKDPRNNNKKYNEEIDEWVDIKPIPEPKFLDENSLELRYPYHYVVNGELYASVEDIDIVYNKVYYYDNSKGKERFWYEYVKKPEFTFNGK